MNNDWDPFTLAPADRSQLTPQTSYRMKRYYNLHAQVEVGTKPSDDTSISYERSLSKCYASYVAYNCVMAGNSVTSLGNDIKNLMEDPLPNVLLELDETDFMKVHVLITGAESTPYEKGFFYFVIGFPTSYPYEPPKVRFMTTSAGMVRFNPNLYSSGKVCLSILGTFLGDKWSSAMGLRSVILSIQSLLNENPYTNEPGHSEESKPGDFDAYKQMIQYYTIKVAVIGNVLNETHIAMPLSFQSHIYKHFLINFEFYEAVIVSKIDMTGTLIRDPLYGYSKGTYQYDLVLDHLESTKAQVLSSTIG